MNKSFKDILNDLLTPEQKVALKAEFNALPVIPTPTPEATPAPAVFGEGKLMDGTIVKYDTEVLGVGSIVTVVTEAGELPAPDGEHELENGDKITITGGKVEKIETKQVEDVVVETPMAQAPISNPLVDALKALMEGKFEAQNKEVNELKTIVAEQAKALEAFKSFFSSLVETPTGKPVVKDETFLSKRKQIFVSKYIK